MSDLIDVYARRLKAAGRSPYTISTRTRVLRHADRWMIAGGCEAGLDSAGDEDIIAYLARPLKAWSQATNYSHLRGYYSTMVKAGRLTKDPTDFVPRPASGDRTPNPVENWELVTAISDSPEQPWRTAVILAAYAGLRCCELCLLEREDVTESHVHVKRGKGGKGRYVPTHPRVWDLVKDRPAGLLISTATGQPILPEHLSSKQRVHWDSIGLPGVHMHRFRHWFGTSLADNGVGIEVIRELMGHKNIETTRGYIRVSVVRQQSAMLALPMLDGHQPDDSRLVPAAAA